MTKPVTTSVSHGVQWLWPWLDPQLYLCNGSDYDSG